MATYGRILLPVATPKAQPLRVFLSFYSYSTALLPRRLQRHRSSVPSAATRRQNVFVATQLLHVLHFTLQLLSGCQGGSGERLRATVQSADVKCFLWHGADRSQLNPTAEEGSKVKSPPSSTRCDRVCFLYTFRYLINPSVIAQLRVADTDTFHQLSLPQASAIPCCPRSQSVRLPFNGSRSKLRTIMHRNALSPCEISG